MPPLNESKKGQNTQKKRPYCIPLDLSLRERKCLTRGNFDQGGVTNGKAKGAGRPDMGPCRIKGWETINSFSEVEGQEPPGCEGR